MRREDRFIWEPGDIQVLENEEDEGDEDETQ